LPCALAAVTERFAPEHAMTLLEFTSVALLLLVVVALSYNAFAAAPGSWTDALAVIHTSFDLARVLLHI
jgi:hypothetical protein